MIKKLLASTLILGVLSTTLVADGVKVGVGVALTANDATIRVPLDIASNLRIEPEVSYGYTSYDDGSSYIMGLGAGVYLMSQPASNVNLYYGAKMGFVVGSTSYDLPTGGSKSVSDNSFGIAPTAGFEYFLDPHVSLGGEVGFRLGFGDVTNVGLTTATTLRYYF